MTARDEDRDAAARPADDALGGPALRDGGAPRSGGLAVRAAAGAAAWLAAMTLIGLALHHGVEGLGPAAAAAIALAATAPFAVFFGLAGLAARLDDLERRTEAMHRAQARLAAELPRLSARPPDGPDPDRLGAAVAAAARDAVDREWAEIGRRIAGLAETQERLDAGLAALAALMERGVIDGAAHAEARARAPSSGADRAPDDPAAPAPASRKTPAATIPAAPPREADAPDSGQPSLPLAEQAAPGAPDWGVIATALNFPRDESDAEGFAALDAAIRDGQVSALLQAAEDMLTMLAQHGVYMEDLDVRLAPASAWAAFARGARGPQVAAVGGVDAPEAVEAARGMMKADPIVRDTAMHLMRRFDVVLRRAADDPRAAAQLPALGDSRTGRAFMLVAQAVGAFD